MECISKGKVRKPYEFGVKVSIATTHKEGLVIGARSMPGNPYDGHTLAEALEQAAILSDVQPEIAIVDRGYGGEARFLCKSRRCWCRRSNSGRAS
ncbi:hypothetical protein WJ36_01690 [Burkholderia ubonensis]|nr:hypothetical protein WJ36_01690 [Burkholderia ubonensis]